MYIFIYISIIKIASQRLRPGRHRFESFLCCKWFLLIDKDFLLESHRALTGAKVSIQSRARFYILRYTI